MSKTIMEKIMTAHAGKEAHAGDVVWIDLDVRSARDFGGANVVKNLQKYYSDDDVQDVAKTFFTFDCVVPAKTIPYANNQQICRDFAAAKGIRVYDVREGIGSHIMIEEGLSLPGKTVVGTDSHMNILGAVGAFGQGMGDQDIAFAFKTGKTWFQVPPTMKVIINGKPHNNITAKDITLFVVKNLGSKGALGQAVEFYGEAIDNLDLAGRITLASMVTEMGGIVGFIPPNDDILNYFFEQGIQVKDPVYADEDAPYTQVLELDITDLQPQIACPPSPASVKDVKEVAGRKIHSVFVGSCTNGRYEDFAMVAEVLKGKQVAPGVMMKVVPSTRRVYKQMLDNGLVQDLFDAGVIVSNPGCGGCASGQIGMTGHGEVQLSTGNRNFPGKQGNGENYLVSPLVAAISALMGEITVP